MWVSPNHPNPPRPYEAPQDDGQLLGTFPRGDGRDELRVTLKEFEGRPFVALRVWSRDERGDWWPVKGKGVSVRLGEVAGVIDALRAAGDLDRRRPQSRPAEVSAPRSGGPQRPDYREAGSPRAAGGGGFDEFAGG